MKPIGFGPLENVSVFFSCLLKVLKRLNCFPSARVSTQIDEDDLKVIMAIADPDQDGRISMKV